MFQQTRTSLVAFVGGVVVGVAGLFFLGGGRNPGTIPAAQAAEQNRPDQKEVPQVGRYGVFTTIDIGNTRASLLDTTTGKVWSLVTFIKAGGSTIEYKWTPVVDGPK